MLTFLRRASMRQRIGGIVAVHALLMVAAFVLVIDGVGSRAPIYLVPEPARVAAIVSVFERAAPDIYGDIARALSDDRHDVRLLPTYPAAAEITQARTRAVAADFRIALRGRPFRIETGTREMSRDLDDRLFYAREPIRVIVSLPNGRAVEMRRTAPARVGRFISHARLILFLVILFDLAVIFWLAAQTTRPVERLVRAVRSDDPNAMVPDGPRELIELGLAFRDLRSRLRGLVEERTRIIAAVAHDFRTYLTRLELRSDFIDDEEQRAAAIADLREMRQLMDDALAFGRPGGDTRDLAVVDLHRELVRAVAGQREVGHAVTLVTGPETGVQTSAVGLQRMIGNLLDNAARYGGGDTHLGWALSDHEILISVEDRGPGLPEERLGAMLEPFARMEESRARHTGGVGLGLAIVQALAHRAGGTLTLVNRPEGGLKAELRLLAVAIEA